DAVADFGPDLAGEGFLVAEVVVEAALGNVGQVDDLVDAHRVHVPLREQRPAGAQQRLAGAVPAPVGTPSGRGGTGLVGHAAFPAGDGAVATDAGASRGPAIMTRWSEGIHPRGNALGGGCRRARDAVARDIPVRGTRRAARSIDGRRGCGANRVSRPWAGARRARGRPKAGSPSRG